MKHYRHRHCIVHLNDAGLVELRQVYPSINQAKLANRGTWYRELTAKTLPQAQSYEVETMPRVRRLEET